MLEENYFEFSKSYKIVNYCNFLIVLLGSLVCFRAWQVTETKFVAIAGISSASQKFNFS